jgi:hypothetical protein
VLVSSVSRLPSTPASMIAMVAVDEDVPERL